MRATRLLVSAISLAIIAAAGYGLYSLFTFKPDFSMPQMPPPTVTVAKPLVQDVEEFYDFTGTTVAVEEVEIRARVQGFLEKIHFVEGSTVKKGDLLFEIERQTHEAIRDQALARLQSNRADLTRAQLDLERVEQAVKTNAVSKQEVTTRRAQRDQAQAAVTGAEAALKQAEQDLSYTRIYSPTDGRISRRMVDVGNLVGAGEQTLLATVVRLRPIYVHFHVSESLLVDRIGVNSLDGQSSMPFSVACENEPNFPHEGVVNYMDNTVDPGTGTILLRGELPNTDEAFLPGMFVRVRLPVGILSDAVCVHDSAVGTDIGGKYMLLVNDKNVVERRPVQIGRTIGRMRVITSGLSAEDSYIVTGSQFVQAGMTVGTTGEGQQQAPGDPNAAEPDQPGVTP